MDNQHIEYIPLDIVKKAEKGDATAQLELGKAYYSATSVKNHDTIAFEWILLSAEQGNIEAQFRLGDMYALGFGTAKSLSDSYKWYTKAAIQGYKKALIRINNLYQGDLKMHCRGQIHSKEERWTFVSFKKKHKIRELYEYRLEQNKSTLNGAITYYTQQFKQYQSSDQKDATVQLNLAFLYQHGYGTKKYNRCAFEYYSLAAEQGDRDAQYNLGCLYQQHTDKKFNVRDAFKWYTRSAQGGHMAAQRCLAYFYLKGLATDINYEIAVSWYTKAAVAGDSQAQVTLGLLYRKGDYIKQDLSVAVKWYKLAVREGNIVAQNCLSQLHQRGMLTNIDLDEKMVEQLSEYSINNRLCSKLSVDISKLENTPEFKQLNKLAKHALIGDGPAMFEIGLKYCNGDEELTQDEETGIKWIKNAAIAKCKNARVKLADLYKRGDVIEQDYHKASIWYKAVAKTKDAEAQFNVGIMYREGFGVRKDPLEASKWFIWASDQGNSDGLYNFGELRFEGQDIKKDEEEAFECFYKSIQQKNIQAAYKLGNIYFDSGDKEKVAKGLQLLKFAAKNGNTSAQVLLGRIYNRGYKVEKDISISIRYYTMAANDGNENAKYELGMTYLRKDCTTQDHIKIYNLLKQTRHLSIMLRTPLTSLGYNNIYSKTIELFTVVTEKGIEDLTYNIGCLYRYGTSEKFRHNIDTNYSKAEEWYLIASKKGDSRADYELGIMYEYGKGVQKDLIIAINYYNKAIRQKNNDAAYRLACFYLNGYGVTQDLINAFHLLTEASNTGHENAGKMLAAFYKMKNDDFYPDFLRETGPDITITQNNLICMLENATEKGYAQLQYQLGVFYEQNGDTLNAFKWLDRAADIGIMDAYYRVGTMYEEGRGVEQNYVAASSMFQKATQKDHEDACYRLGRLYQYGNGVPKSYSKAYSFYKKAAEMNHKMASKVLDIQLETKIQTKEISSSPERKEYQESFLMCKYVAEHGNTEEQFKVGIAYEHNYSEPNYGEAFKWYSMAAKSSHGEATYRLGLLYEKGLGVCQDNQKAIQLYNQAYKLGSDNAVHRLGTVYHHGKGVEKSTKKAIEYYTHSAELGNPEYQCELGRLYEEGELVQKDILQALEWYTRAYLQGYDNIRSTLYAMYDEKPYECFFWGKLFRALSVASCNHFDLHKSNSYEVYGNLNNRLGTLYFFRQGTERDLAKALEFFLKEYSFTDEILLSLVGFLLYDGLTSSQKINILETFEREELLMSHTTANQLYELGMIYRDGVVESQNEIESYIQRFSVYSDKFINNQNQDNQDKNIIIEKNHFKSFKYLEKAANKNHPEALLQLGIMYCCGYGTDKNPEQGEQIFKIVSNIDEEYIQDIATLYHTYSGLQNFPKAFEWYKRLKKILEEKLDIPNYERNNINMQLNLGLGLLYEYGDGVEKSYQKAQEYYKKLANDNFAQGFYNLGVMYYYGKGSLVNYDEAFNLFQKVVYKRSWLGTKTVFVYDQNSLHSQDLQRNPIYCTISEYDMIGESNYYLGLMYQNGRGVAKDEAMAQVYFRDALKEGCERAKNEIN